VAPTARDRRLAQDFVRDVEFDCLAYARTASNMADKLRRAREGRRSFSLGAIYLMVLSFLPTLYALHVERGWDHTSLGLWAVAIPWAIAIIAGTMHHNDRIQVLSNKESNLRGEATNYTSVADNAKKLRMNELQTETVSRQRLADIGQDVLRQKAACDRGFNLSAVDLQEAKRQVREALIDDMDPEKLLRVDVGELPPEEDAEQDEERRSVG